MLSHVCSLDQSSSMQLGLFDAYFELPSIESTAISLPVEISEVPITGGIIQHGQQYFMTLTAEV